MTHFTRDDAAARGGVDRETLDQLVELRVVIPNESDRLDEAAVRKIGLVSSFLATGIPADAIAAEIRDGHLDLTFLDNPTFVTFMALSDITFEELATERGIPVEVLLAIREAIGSAVPRPTDHVREIELGIVPSIEAQLAVGYTPDSVERLVRVLGDGLRRYVLAGAEAFQRHVIEPLGGASGQEIGAAAGAASERITGPIDDAVVALYRAQLGNAWTANIVEAVTRHLAESGVVGAPARNPAMCFLDITGYTRLTSTSPGRAYSAMRAARLTVEP